MANKYLNCLDPSNVIPIFAKCSKTFFCDATYSFNLKLCHIPWKYQAELKHEEGEKPFEILKYILLLKVKL